MTIKSVRKELNRLQKATKDKFQKDERKIATVLLSACIVGTDREKIRKFTGIPIKFLEPVIDHLEESKVFENGKVCHSGWFHKKDGYLAFCLDIAVGKGYLQRSS